MIEQATIGDADELFRLLSEEMWPENGRGEIDRDKAMGRIVECLTDGIVWVIREGRIVATVALYEVEGYWWSRDTYVTDAWLFVSKDYRVKYGLQLFRAIRDFSRRTGLTVKLGLSSGADLEKKAKMFERFGTPVAVLYEVA